ncbi:hypothetical protein QOZ80_1AG0023490 [Eleusine coracana subsp. coracana]|nr:hypothetical protein QOZ80_1AG0023490 [Eleusine coracana subsp. coracana]
MENEFQISMMGELTFFLGLQIKQCKQGTFIHQAKYTNDLLKKFNMVNVKPLSIPMPTTTTLDPDEDCEAVDQREYRSMISSLLYLMAIRPDIHFAVYLCARFHASPRVTHRKAVKRIFRKSTSGTCHFLGTSLIYWSSHKQSSVAQSTTEAKVFVIPSRATLRMD